MSKKDYKPPVVKIWPDVEYMPPEDYELPEMKIVIANDDPNKKYCPHDRIKIFPHYRVIQCAECNATLEPFDYLLSVGRLENNELSSIKYLKNQLKRLQQEEEEHKKTVAKLRAEIKKLNK